MNDDNERPDMLALVVEFCALYEIPSPHRLLDWYPMTRPYTHPLFGDTVAGITDGVLCYAIFARGVKHVALGQMTPLTLARARRSYAALKEPEVVIDVHDLY